MIQIRKSFDADAYNLIKLKDEVWKSEFYDILPNGILNNNLQLVDERVKHLHDQINENNRIFVAINEESQIVGYIFYGKATNAMYNTAVEIRDIYIMPKYQKQGIGLQLFNMAIEEIKKLGFHSLIIYCPLGTRCINFFLNLGGQKKELISKDISGYQINCDLIYFDLDKHSDDDLNKEWNLVYSEAQNKLVLLNDNNREIAVILTESGSIYYGIGIKNKVCPLESALSNMYLNQDKKIKKILILNRKSKPVLPCGKCRDLMINLGETSAEILFDYGTLETMTMKDLNPYYKDEEKQ